MARPIKNSCDYFPHDGGMRNHRKVKAVITKFGITGYAHWSMLLEILTTSENYTITIDSEIDWELLAADMHSSSENLKTFLDYLIVLKLLNNEGNLYWSDNLIDRFSALLNKRIRAKKAFEEGKEIEAKIGKKIQSTNGINRATRLVVYEKCNYKCTDCHTEDKNILDVHHVIERHKGGSDEPENLILLCANCHRKAHSRQVSVTETNVSVESKTQSKVKESKVNKSKVKYEFLQNSNLEDIFMRWMKYKEWKGQRYKGQDSVETCFKKLKKLSGENLEAATEIIENAIANNWAGFFGLHGNSNYQISKKSSETFIEQQQTKFDSALSIMDKLQNNG